MMKEYKEILISYLRSKSSIIMALIVVYLTFIIVFSLYTLPLEAIFYGVLLSFIILIIIGAIGFSMYYKKYSTLNKLKISITVTDFKLPTPKDPMESLYQELIRILDRDRIDIINKKDKSYGDMIDYYTIWAHQIKTPIAAMRLILQSEKSEKNIDLLDQLFKIEQYVDMVLQYLRVESIHSDLMFKRYSLDNILKQAIRKYSGTFIRKKIKLNYEEINIDVLTDEKWLVFVVEQILSNALKYTNEGEISIYMDDSLPDTLVIEDTGIGIAEEDLPRIFEKGYTGFNGRNDKKSTGIGLYLCKRILNNMSHTITIESAIDNGTRVKIGLDTVKMILE